MTWSRALPELSCDKAGPFHRDEAEVIAGKTEIGHLYRIVDGDQVVAQVDAAWPDTRQNTLVLLGWTVLRFTWNDVVRRPATIATAAWVGGRRAVAGILGDPPTIVGRIDEVLRHDL